MTRSSNELTRLQRAVLAMKEMDRRIETLEGARSEPIAVVGIACRFPGGADTPEAFWRLLLDGTDAVTEVPPERWDVDAWYDPDPDHAGTMNTRCGGFLPDVDLFDPHFFGMSEHEAMSMDPQHRLLLEVAWEALERAGIPPSTLEESRTGVYVGITAMEYIHILNRAGAVNAYYVGGAPLCAAAGRLSHLLGLQGPSMSIDTACSSALVSIHQACRSLRDGESDLALAGGVNLTLTPHGTVFLSRAHMLARDGRCKTFSADANGFVRGEGCGILVLRRLKDAVAAGDPIQGVILGSAVNHDGHSNGFTAPNGRSQERLIRQAVENARVDPGEMGLVETHGTGTALGDPIEVEAIGKALCSGRDGDRPLLLGAVKTNLGHLEAAAGAAGMIKALLSVKEGRIPGNLHFGEPNPLIPWDRLSVEVPQGATQWPAGQERRVAGVSAFGATGTNAHVVIAGPPDPGVPPEEPTGDHLLVLSARNPQALWELASRYAEHLDSCPGASFAHVCFTAAVGRDHFRHRLALVAGSGEAAVAALAGFARGEGEGGGLVVGQGQGAHPPEVGLSMSGETLSGQALPDLLALPAFRQAFEACTEGREPSAPLERFAAEYALARLWQAWGVVPAGVSGIDEGAHVARVVAGITSLEDGIREALEGAMDGAKETGSLERFGTDDVDWVVTTGVSSEAFEGGSRVVSFPASGEVVPGLLQGLARLYVAGVPVDVGAVERGGSRRKVVLPTYPFQRVRCWPDAVPFSPSAPDLAPDPLPSQGPAPDAEGVVEGQLEQVGEALLGAVKEQLAGLVGRARVVMSSEDASRATRARVALGEWNLLLLASSSAEGLERDAGEMAGKLKEEPEAVPRIGSLASGEAAGPHRTMVVFREPREAGALLAGEAAAGRRMASGVASPEPPSVAFMFPGLGDHYPEMARGLYESSPAFRRRLDLCAALLEPELETDLRKLLFPGVKADDDAPPPAMDLRRMLGRSPDSGGGNDPLARISLAHSAIFSVEYALAGLWQDWGVSPGALLGFSLGEIIGATLAGVMSLKEGLTLVARRARVIETLPRGAMLAIPLPLGELSDHLGGGLGIAVECAPGIQVVGGPPEEIAGLEARLAERDVVSRRLHSDYAFHTRDLAGQEEPVRRLVAGFDLRPPRIPLCSNTNGGWLEPDEATDPGYWARHTMRPVRFGKGVDRLLETDGQIIVEVGPGQGLTSFALQSPALELVSAVEFVPSLRSRHESDPDAAFFLGSLGRLWISGIQIKPPEEED